MQVSGDDKPDILGGQRGALNLKYFESRESSARALKGRSPRHSLGNLKSHSQCPHDEANTKARSFTVEARKLEHARPPTPNQRKKENQHKSSHIYVPNFWSQSTVNPHTSIRKLARKAFEPRSKATRRLPVQAPSIHPQLPESRQFVRIRLPLFPRAYKKSCC